ncbi:hypothetical protein [Apibacter sp. HY039]|uniref:hypothetical protein n=1 Tax=Apibacter sp. HY039 TaxID=2501476 RepID=UPI000FEBAAFD|nr:hypothetical protein [Apibacter sp. HY039]
MKKKMTKTNERYTYEDLMLRKRILKLEIKEIESMASLENLPQTLGAIGGSIKNKTLDLIQNPNAMSMLIDAGVGLGAEKIISRFVNKKSIAGKAIILASTYLIPVAVRQTKNLIVNLSKRKNKDALYTSPNVETIDMDDDEEK